MSGRTVLVLAMNELPRPKTIKYITFLGPAGLRITTLDDLEYYFQQGQVSSFVESEAPIASKINEGWYCYGVCKNGNMWQVK